MAMGVKWPTEEQRVEALRQSRAASVARWRAAHPEETREQKRRYYLQNRDKAIALNRAWRAANPEKVLDQRRRSYDKTRSQYVTYEYRLDGVPVYVGSGNGKRPACHARPGSQPEWWSSDLELVLTEHPSIAHARRDEYDRIIRYTEAGIALYNKDGLEGLSLGSQE
jgi:hypothetical protein